MTLVRYAFISSNDDKIHIFAPHNKSITLEKLVFAQVFQQSLKDNPDIMPQTITGLGLSFGEMSQTQYDKLINTCKRYGGEIEE